MQSAAKESGMAQRAFADTISAIRDELRTEMQKRHETSHKATEELFEALKKDLENQQGQVWDPHYLQYVRFFLTREIILLALT